MIEGPGIFLCFDDQYIDKWHEWLDFFDREEMKVTFYITNLRDITDVQWSKANELYMRGHTIACHSFNHIHANQAINESGCQEYLEREIYTSLSLFENYGITDVKHFSYPWGAHDLESDRCLFGVFDTLRVGGGKNYTRDEILKARLLGTWAFGKNPKDRYCAGEDRLRIIADKKMFTVSYMHEPVKHWLEWLANFGKANGINFYSMSVLNRGSSKT